MEGVETSGAVILKTRALRKLELQIGKAGLAFVKNRSTEESVALNVQHYFGQTLCCGEEVVRRVGRVPRGRVAWRSAVCPTTDRRGTWRT